MERTYTELIDDLRRVAKTTRKLNLEGTGVAESGHADLLDKAADAIETLSRNIDTYADAAFERAQELGYAKERIMELDELCACYCNERDELRLRIEELVDKYEEQTAAERTAPAPDPVVHYLCDRRVCEWCSPECKHTTDPRHAKHFEFSGGALFEQGV